MKSFSIKQLLISVFVIFWASAAFSDAIAQETAQVNIIGIPGVLSSPFFSDLEDNYNSGMYQVQFIYTSNSVTPREFEFVLTLIHDGRQIFEERSQPRPFLPGTYMLNPFFDEVEFDFTVGDMLDQIGGKLQSQILQSGALPEGNFGIRIQAVPVDAQPMVNTIPGVANFVVRFPQPPILVTPPDQSQLLLDVPVFTWTPVVVPGGIQIEYEFLLVELFEGQNPGDALLSNRPQHEMVQTQTSLPYTPDLLPLEKGKSYAWQVTARDANPDQGLPLANDGESDIYTFTFGATDEDADVDDLQQIVLVPEFSRIVDPQNLDITTEGNELILNGQATAEYTFFDGTNGFVTATANNLRILNSNLANPVITGGTVDFSASQTGGLMQDLIPDFVEFDLVRWGLGTGIEARLVLDLPFGDNLKAESLVNLDRNGLSGTAEVTGSPIAAFEQDLVSMELSSITAQFPAGTVSAGGDIRVMGEDTGCELTNFNMETGTLSASFNCQQTFEIPLVSDSPLLTFEVNRILGGVELGLDDGSLDFDLTLRSTLGLLTMQGNYCGTGVNISLVSGEPVSLQQTAASCPEVNPRLNLGFAELRFQNTQLSQLEFDPATGEWDFELGMDVRLDIPAFDQWSSPRIDGLTLSRDGIEFESINFADGTRPLPAFDINRLHLALDTFNLNEFTFPLFGWDQTGPGPWEIEFAGSGTIKSGSGIPYCLVGTTLALENGSVRQNRVAADLELQDFETCQWQLSPFVTVELSSLSGMAGARYLDDGSIEPFGDVAVGGGVYLDGPFQCDGQQTTSFSAGDLIISNGLQGTLENVVPDCPVNIGPFEAQVTQSDISFSREHNGQQKAEMDASASITLPDGQSASGSFTLDLISGTFTDVDFLIQGPFDWNIPSDENPVLTFRLDQAGISADGFMVDGRQDFLLADETRRVTFDNLVLDLNTWMVNSGRVLFDESFAFEAGIGSATDFFGFAAVLPETEFALDPGIKMELGATVVIDSTGIATSGTASASVAFNGRSYDSLLMVEYSEDFAFGLNPFGIYSGRADFYYDGDHIAWADADGFHPVLAFFADNLIPERLPMPQEEIAYIQLREGEDLLVNVVEDTDGNLVISSLDGQPVTLVMPYLNPANPPEIAGVSFNDFTITANPFNPQIVSGSITAEVPEQSPLFDLSDKNIPLSLRSIEYGIREVDGSDISALYLLGDLNLFDQEIEGDSKADFYIQGDGFVRASFQLSDLGGQLSLVPGDRAIIGVDAVEGMFAMQMGSSSPTYDISVSGSVEVLTDEGYRAGADITIRTTDGGFFSIPYYDGYAFDESPRLGIGDFGLELDEILEIPHFSYSPQDGFEFAIALDLGIRIPLSEGQEIYFPLKGVEIRHNGVHFPSQDINDSVIPGLNLPEVDLGGFGFKPLALRTPGSVTFSWEDGVDFDPVFLMDFHVELPDFDGTGLNPPDGLLFSNVGFDDGFLVGSVDPFEPQGGAEIPVAPGENPPTLIVNELSGALSKVPHNSYRQAVDFAISGTIGNLPSFEPRDDEDCGEGASFDLAIIQGNAFEGSISNVQPCGVMTLGPVSMEVASANLNLYLSEDEQIAELDGSVDITLPVREGNTPGTVTGSLVLDVISGTISDGSVAITQPFDLGMPWHDDDPLFSFAMNEATLSSEGLMLTGAGQLEKGDVDVDVSFDQLLVGLEEFEIKSGSATISSGFAAQMSLSPMGLSLVPTDAPLPDDNVLRFNVDAAVTLDSQGLGFAGAADATIIYSGESYSNLRVELVDNFTVSITGFAVKSGRAEFYWDQDGETAEEPLAVLDANGFSLGGGLIALLPDRIPLPSEDIAYLEIKDEQGNPLISIEQDGTGYILSTDGGYLPLVIPALPDSQGEPFVVQAGFTLVTDDIYNVTGGSLSLQTESSLESRLNLPVRLSALELDTDEGISLTVGLGFDLPAVFGDHEALVMATLTSSGIESGSFEAGNFSTIYDPDADPLYTFSTSGELEGDTEDTFAASLMGIEASFGSNMVRFSGTIFSSLILEEGDTPVFFYAGWEEGSWDFSLNPGDALEDISLGQAKLTLDGEDPLRIHAEDDDFRLIINGMVDFEDLLGEPFQLTIKDLELGVNNWNSNPSLHFALGEAIGDLGDQYFALFNEAVELHLVDPSISLSGRNLAVQSDGNIVFLERSIGFEGLMLSTAGGFSLDEASVSDIQLAGEYVTLKSLTLAFDTGIRLTSEFDIKIPEPFEDYAEDSSLILELYRDEDGIVTVDGGGLQVTPGPEQAKLALGEFGEVRLTRLRVDIDPFNAQSAGLYANAVVSVDKGGDEFKDVIFFGSDSNFSTQPGIGVSYSASEGVEVAYNVTGNAEFDVGVSFFMLSLSADITSSDQQAFLIELSGTADINLEAMDASIGYEGVLIDKTGVTDWGNLSGTGDISINDIVTLEIGPFLRQLDEDGFDIEITDTNERDPQELRGAADGGAATRSVSGVVELVCFGPCPVEGTPDYTGPAINVSIGADGNTEGGFSGGVESVFFYRTVDDMSLIVEGLNIAIDDIFSMTAGLEYVNEDGEVLVRAAATGSLNAGGTSASAVVAGKFSNIGGQVSYGLFVGVSASPGIPIVPGIVDLTGAGGGFFYRPEEADFIMVDDALSDFGYDLVNSDVSRPVGDVDFAIMLYAGVGVGGSGGTYVVDGATFIQITNQSFYMDVSGYVYTLDGEGSIANATARAGLYASAIWDSDGMASIMFGGEANFEVPDVMEGEGQIDFFYTRVGDPGDDNYVWGVIGGLSFNVWEGTLTGSSELAIGPPGFYFDLLLTLHVDPPIVDVESSIEVIVWMVTDDNFAMPFGAFAEFSGSACVTIFCITATATGAFVTKNPSGYELFAALQGCVGSSENRCLAAWASVSDSGVSAGLGTGEHADIIEQARGMAEYFDEQIGQLITELNNAIEASNTPTPLEDLIPDAETYILAGEILFGMPDSQRQNWVSAIQANEGIHSVTVSNLMQVAENILGADRPANDLTPSQELAIMTDLLNSLNQMFSSATGVIQDDLMTSVGLLEDSQEIFNQFADTFVQSPISNLQRPAAVDGQSQSVTFDFDDATAQQQAASGESLRAEMEQLDEQFRASMGAIRSNVNAMENLLVNIVVTTGILGDWTLIDTVGFYSFVTQYFERYYAAMANEYNINYEWANELRQQYQNMESGVVSDISALRSEFLDSSIDVTSPWEQDNLERIARTTAQRAHIAMLLSDGETGSLPVPAPANSSYSEIVDIYDGLANYPFDRPRADLINSLHDINNNFWRTLPNNGLQSYANRQLETLITQVALKFQNDQNQITETHSELTQVMETFFDIKATMTSLLWNITDNYIEWRSGFGDDTDMFEGAPALQTFINRRNNLGRRLQPPQITSVTAIPNREEGNFYNKVEISWQATHPIKVIEYATNINYRLFDGSTDVTRDTDGYLTIGNGTQTTLYPSRLIPGINTTKVNFGIRARGPAGNTSIRRVNFDVDVGPGGSTTPPGEVLPDETNPPEAPVVLLSEAFSYSSDNGQTAFWTNQETQQFNLVINGYDPEVGIGRFEYAIGTTPGGTELLDWSRLEGQREVIPQIPAEQMQGSTRFVTFEEGVNYYVSARVENVMGQMSPVAVADGPIVLDMTPPEAPDSEISTPSPVQPGWHWPTQYETVSSVPPLEISIDHFYNWITPYGPPEILFNNISAEENISGISHYEYVLSHEEAVPHSRFSAGDFGIHEGGELHITGAFDDPVFNNFTDEVYLHIRAVDYAGNRSAVTTSGLHIAFDHTVPEAGVMKAMLTDDAIKLYMTRVPYDPESDVLGIQYSVHWYDGGQEQVIRSFPSGTEVDLEWGFEQSFYSLFGQQFTRHISIPRDGLPIGQNLYILFRSVNTKGSYSKMGETGPINLDETPPITPSIGISAHTQTRKITLDIGDIHDPESGVKKVEYLVKAPPFFSIHSFGLGPVVAYHVPYPQTNPMSLNVTTSAIPEGVSLEGLRVTVRVTNGAGLVRTRHRVIQSSDLFTPITLPPPTIIPLQLN